ncbi:hypothetical protein [Bacillus sp. FJAT-45350]|uniref:hypothetical protein n=1 Tax=Bacillus sp. FJAT-45350 TaxID=2011014 RepID=UPI000BB8EBF2|nr:hypothetical protein [Bacillus sp. FJAT-45350]
MKKQILSWMLLIIALVTLSACGPQVTIEGDRSESKLIVDEERDFLTFYARIENTSKLPTDNLYLKFELHHPTLIEQFGQDTVVFANEEQIPTSFTVKPNSGYFVGETFDYTGDIPLVELENVVEVVVFNDDGEDMERFVIENVEREN